MPIITITGDLASGKSRVAKEIATRMSVQYFSTGLIQRRIAADLNMTTLELNKYSEEHPEIDEMIDKRITDLSLKQGSLIVDSRMAWHFLPSSFKVYLTVDVVKAAERVMADDQRSNEPVYQDLNTAINKLQERKNSENTRYLKLYQANCALMDNFDVVVDSTFSTPEETLEIITSLFNSWTENNVHHFWLCPQNIYPMKDVRVLISEDASRLQRKINDNGFDPLLPVEVVEVNRRYYIWNGHKRVNASIKNSISHIPVLIIAKNDEEVLPGLTAKNYVSDTYSQSLIFDWEDAFDITYLSLKS